MLSCFSISEFQFSIDLSLFLLASVQVPVDIFQGVKDEQLKKVANAIGLASKPEIEKQVGSACSH